jgi:hypothetical protein
MYILAQLVFESYMPDKITKGMWFKQHITEVIYGQRYAYDRLFELQITVPEHEELSYLDKNGYPVRPLIVSITANPDEIADIIAQPNMIGWWDDGASCDELRDVTMFDFNNLLQHESGVLEIELADHMYEQGIAEPILYDGKVTIRITTDDEYHDDYENWDDMDDETNHDPEN